MSPPLMHAAELEGRHHTRSEIGKIFTACSLVESMEEVDQRASDASCRPIDGSFAAMVDGLDLTPGRPERDEYRLEGGGESRPTGDDPRRDADHEARADFGAEAPLRRVGS